MRITLNKTPHELPEATTLMAAVAALSPYGAEPVIVLLNGARADVEPGPLLKDGDEIDVFPLLIGG